MKKPQGFKLDIIISNFSTIWYNDALGQLQVIGKISGGEASITVSIELDGHSPREIQINFMLLWETALAEVWSPPFCYYWQKGILLCVSMNMHFPLHTSLLCDPCSKSYGTLGM